MRQHDFVKCIVFLKPYILKYWINFLLFYIGWLGISVLELYIPILFGRMVDVLVNGIDINLFCKIGIEIAVLYLISWSYYMMIYRQHNILITRFAADIKIDIFDKYKKMEYKGKAVIIRGESGSGKTTLLSLLIKAHSYDSGQIIINKCIDFKSIQEKEWYEKISCYMSDMELLPGTIKDNLLYAKSDASEDDMEVVLRLTEVWETICNMPGGLETEVLEGGSNLSGGQQQRILLARTLLKEADFYLFDEPTSALDMELEKKIMTQLNKLAETKLVFIITHSKREPMS